MTPLLFQRFAIGALAWNLLVILWGAYVRATGSGAGCGDHWPLCNGEVIPREPSTATLIEYTHRVTSGLTLVMAVGLYLLARRVPELPPAARKAAGWTLVFTIGEALVGAMIVLQELVAHDDSAARAAIMGLHLCNTFLLLGALALTALCAGGRPLPAWRGRMGAILIGGTAGMMLLGASGGVAALGDTLFPVTSLGEGFAQDLSPGAHFLVRLRVLHPLLAFSVAALVSAMALWGALAARGPDLRSASWMLISLFFLQIVVGFINLGLLAPVPLQLLHLLMADLVWMGFVRFASLWTQEREAREAAPRA